MVGVITTRDLVLHAHDIVKGFGFRTYIRCVRAVVFSRKPVTFLDCIYWS